MNNTNIKIFAVALICLSVCTAVYMSMPKIRVIRMGYVFENYDGRIEATQKLEKIADGNAKMLDSLNQQLMLLYQKASEDNTQSAAFQMLQHKYSQLKNQFDQEYNEKDGQLSQGVLNQVNAELEKYCEKHNIDILLGHLSGEGVLHSKPYYDDTDAFLELLNKQYSGDTDE